MLIVDDEPYNLMALNIILGQAEKLLLTKLFGAQIMERNDCKISDLVDRASNG